MHVAMACLAQTRHRKVLCRGGKGRLAGIAAHLPACALLLCHNADQRADQDGHWHSLPQEPYPGKRNKKYCLKIKTANTFFIVGFHTMLFVQCFLSPHVMHSIYLCCAYLSIAHVCHIALQHCDEVASIVLSAVCLKGSTSKRCMKFIPRRVLTRWLAVQKTAEAECAPADMSEDSAN